MFENNENKDSENNENKESEKNGNIIEIENNEYLSEEKTKKLVKCSLKNKKVRNYRKSKETKDEHKNNEIKDEFRDVSNTIDPNISKALTLKKPKENEVDLDKKDVQDIKVKKIHKVEDWIKEYFEGRLLWGKVKSYPWWPCMVYKSPDNIFHRHNSVHVVYFGPIVERGWLTLKDIMPFEGKSNFDELVRNLKASHATKKVLKNYCVPPCRLDHWNKAWKEAEEAMPLRLTKRLRHHGVSYNDTDSNSENSSTDEDIPSHSDENLSFKSFTNKPSSSSDLNMEENIISALTPDDKVSEKAVRAGLEYSVDDLDEIISSVLSSKNNEIERAGLTSYELTCSAEGKGDIDIETITEENDNVILTTAKEKRQITMEFTNLKAPSFTQTKRILICLLCLKDDCERSDPVITCSGNCGQTFHVHCMKILLDFLTRNELTPPTLVYKKCVDCNKYQRRCFMCYKLINSKHPNGNIKCCARDCGRYFHASCIDDGIYQNMVQNNRKGSITCPSHTCHSCYNENPATVRYSSSHTRCIMCPASFHRGEWCLPAGSIEINEFHIICPQHLKSSNNFDIMVAPFMDCIKDGVVTLDRYNFIKTSFSDNDDLWVIKKSEPLEILKTNNVTFCFVCSHGGHLICCEKCPASFHQTCVKITELPDYYVCEECQLGKYPKYGEIVWLKVGSYRWWPGQIIHQRNAPTSALISSHEDGQFLVQFFGSYDYYWSTKMHTFSFDEGDDELTVANDSSDESSVEESQLETQMNVVESYSLCLKIAGKVFRRRFNKWAEIINNENRPNHYRKIKINLPVGKVRIQKLPIGSLSHRCECTPGVGKNDLDPCGPSSDCINRQVQYECNPLSCRNQNKCKNQRFMLREYPKLKVFNTKDRGWALKTLEPIKKGTFINEYVGELIDNAEANRRLKIAHENDITNFYMMILDNQRIIDAGPAANESRFINHSCSPNVFTQQWLVNGDHRIGIFASCDIDAEEELTFNYHFVSFGEMKIPCKCGAENCSGFLGLPPKSSSSSDIQNLVKEPKVRRSVKSVLDKVRSSKGGHDDEKEVVVPPGGDVSKKEYPVDECCFICGQGACNLVCDFDECLRAYHHQCTQGKDEPEPKRGDWFCPWHFCDECGCLSDTYCSFCTNSYCTAHLCDRIMYISERGVMKCVSQCCNDCSYPGSPWHSSNS